MLKEMSGLDNLIEQLASATVDDEKTVSFAGRGLQLDTENDAMVIVDALNSCPGMTTFKLEGNTIGVPAAQVIAKALETQPKFKHALWKDMFTRRDKDEIPKALEFFSSGLMHSGARLVELDLSDNAFGPRGLVGVVALLESPCCYSLKKLLLNNNGLGIAGAKMLSSALCNCIKNSRRDGSPLALKVFVCGRNRLENEGAIAASSFLKQLGSLESVEMPQNGIYPEGVQALSGAFACNPDLRVINLEDNTLNERGAELIADSLSSLTKIQVLNFSDCLIKNDGALSLAAVLRSSCPDLRELHLGFNEIKLGGGMALVDVADKKDNLEMLVINGNQFGPKGCRILISAMDDMDKKDKLGSLGEDEGDEEEDYGDGDTDSQDEILEKSGEEEDVEASPHKSPLHRVSPRDFLSHPTADSLVKLHDARESFLGTLQEKPTVCEYMDLFLKICSVVKAGDEKTKSAAFSFADDVLCEAFLLCSADTSSFNNDFLICLGMMKGEERKSPHSMDISGAFLVLEHAVKQPYFHPSTKEFLKFFLSKPLRYSTASAQSTHELMRSLYQSC